MAGIVALVAMNESHVGVGWAVVISDDLSDSLGSVVGDAGEAEDLQIDDFHRSSASVMGDGRASGQGHAIELREQVNRIGYRLRSVIPHELMHTFPSG